MKGSRVQSIIRELRGEKIDIIEWSEDPAIFAANALSPAKVSKVAVMDFEEKKLQVTVETEQQSLAIGKRGQNVRLAARLVGWDIDIRSEEDMKREIAQQMEEMLTAEVVPVTFIEGITPQDSAILAEHGIETIEQLAAASVDDLCDWLDLSVDEAEEQLATVREIVAVREAALAQYEHVVEPEVVEAEATEAEAETEEATEEATSSTTEAIETASEEVATEEAAEEPTETAQSEETIAAEEPDKAES
jgi:N utilization substance protein A